LNQQANSKNGGVSIIINFAFTFSFCLLAGVSVHLYHELQIEKDERKKIIELAQSNQKENTLQSKKISHLKQGQHALKKELNYAHNKINSNEARIHKSETKITKITKTQKKLTKRTSRLERELRVLKTDLRKVRHSYHLLSRSQNRSTKKILSTLVRFANHHLSNRWDRGDFRRASENILRKESLLHTGFGSTFINVIQSFKGKHENNRHEINNTFLIGM
jgi:septal ring factor EnvC (AmiA/AmiB activator)